jgi:FMN reductase
MKTSTVVGNPKARSRTYEAANLVVEALTGAPPDLTIDLVDLGAGLLDWSDSSVTDAIAEVASSDLVVFASPTYKATYTGLLKLFLDRVNTGSLAHVTAVPLMLGGDLRHSLAAEVFLKPVLVELGAACPTRGLFLVDSVFSEPGALDPWLEAARGQIAASTASTNDLHQ